tara:strand:- start:319 stop:690 length:372 start_codon:yes stop_codon:yes gene_type:complete
MILPITIKSRNVLDRLHWSKKSMLKKEYALLIRNQMKLNKHYSEPVKEPKFFTLEIVSYRKRLLDYDNLVGGVKQLLDAMIDEGYIWDDSPKYLDLRVKQVKNSDPLRKKHKHLHNKTWVARY